MIEHKTQAIVLSHKIYGENDLIISFLSKDFGKISAFAASAKKSKKRFTGGIDIFSSLNIQVKRPKSNSSFLWRLEKTQLVDAFYPLRSNLKALASMSYLSECLKNLLADEQKQEDIFLWWENRLKKVSDSTDQSLLSYLKMDFELLSMMGYKPHLEGCVHCGEAQGLQRLYFSFEKGGALCRECYVAGPGMWLSSTQAQMLNINKSKEAFSHQDTRLLGQLMHRFMSHTLGREPKSQNFRWDAMQL